MDSELDFTFDQIKYNGRRKRDRMMKMIVGVLRSVWFILIEGKRCDANLEL